MELKLLFPPDSPPPAAKFGSVSLSADPSLSPHSLPVLLFPNGTKLQGPVDILARISTVPNLYQRDAFESIQIDGWLDYVYKFASLAEFGGACAYVDEYLLHHTFLVGSSLSLADIAIWSALAATGRRWQSLRNSKEYQNLVRWFNSINVEYQRVTGEELALYVGKKGLGVQTGSKAKEQRVSALRSANASGDVSDKALGVTRSTYEATLPGAEMGKVWLRFAPEPSGYLHIGHAKAALLNNYFAERYQGQVILRFDDTNPDKESNEFVENVLKDVRTLGIKYEKVTYTSNYFPQMIEMAEKLIREGKAYVDDTPKGQMQYERMERIESNCRKNNSIEENLKLWGEMIAGSERGLMCCLRGKLDMKDSNKALADPVYYRCNLTPHHRIGSRYKVYPTYDFACPFVDSIEGITHALRSSEYRDRDAQYRWIQKDMGFKEVHLYEFSRVNFVNTLLSKRKLLWFVQNGKVDGWDDPRFPTVQGIIRRGLKIEALKQFMLEQGASKNLNLMKWDKLWAFNKKIIDPVCPRHTAVNAERRVLLTLTNGPEDPFVRIIPKHKKYAGAGEKATTFSKRIWIDQDDAKVISEKEEVTLMDWGNAIITDIQIQKDESGCVVTQLTGELHLEGSVKTTKLKLTWLPENNELVTLSLVDFGHLITKDKLEEDEDFVSVVNPCTRTEIAALGDSNIRSLKQGDIVQLERKGYFRCDVPFVRPSKPVVLFAIPDGKERPEIN